MRSPRARSCGLSMSAWSCRVTITSFAANPLPTFPRSLRFATGCLPRRRRSGRADRTLRAPGGLRGPRTGIDAEPEDGTRQGTQAPQGEGHVPGMVAGQMRDDRDSDDAPQAAAGVDDAADRHGVALSDDHRRSPERALGELEAAETERQCHDRGTGVDSQLVIDSNMA